MKFGVEGQEDSKTIQRYQKCYNTIIITFLDGSIFEIPNTLENEEKIVEVMLEQAYVRDKLINCETQKEEYKNLSYDVIFRLCQEAVLIFGYSATDFKLLKIIASLGISLTTFVLICDLIQIKAKNIREEELEKYHLFLNIRERLALVNDENLFNGVVTDYDLNINTLDYFSLEDVEKIRDNLERVEYAKTLNLSR